MRGIAVESPEMTRAEMPFQPCPGCRASFPVSDGAVHPYIGASAGCWAAYGQVLAREYGEFGYPEVHRLTVDTYAVQHPGRPSRQSIQSVAVHLIGLYLTLERRMNSRATVSVIRAAVNRGGFTWLDPPANPSDLTILTIIDASDIAEHTDRVERWARTVWDAWSAHAATVRAWAEGQSP